MKIFAVPVLLRSKRGERQIIILRSRVDGMQRSNSNPLQFFSFGKLELHKIIQSYNLHQVSALSSLEAQLASAFPHTDAFVGTLSSLVHTKQ